ncbi:hypothetical protein PIB30_066477, partial [Stylosanthes scabra]|nr:hypothetical protein [Stylosanthes scabra]
MTAFGRQIFRRMMEAWKRTRRRGWHTNATEGTTQENSRATTRQPRGRRGSGGEEGAAAARRWIK